MAGPRTGRVAAAFWTYDRDAEDDIDIHFAWGDPATGEWEEPRPTGISGQIAKPVVLQDGREPHDPCWHLGCILSTTVDRATIAALACAAFPR